MRLFYASSTGNVRRFIDKLNIPATEITPGLEVDEPFVLITYTSGFGQVPPIVQEFLSTGKNAKFLRGVSASGNKNWKSGFAKSAHHISLNYRVPVLTTFELSGKPSDVQAFKEAFQGC